MSEWTDEERVDRAKLIGCEPDMLLPRYRICGDCKHFSKCNGLFGCKFASLSCGWSPSRFIRGDFQPVVAAGGE